MDCETAAEGTANAGYKAVRELYLLLTQVVSGGNIPEKLFEKYLIDDDLLELTTNQAHTATFKGKKIARQLLKCVQVNPDKFSTIVDILSSEDGTAKDLAHSLKGAYQRAQKQEQSKAEGSDESICEEFKELKLFLECHKKLLSKDYSDQGSLYKTMQATIRGSTDTALKSLSPQLVRSQMWYMCYKSFDVPSKLREWTIQEVEKMCKSVEAVEKSDPCPPSSDDKKPLMNKDTLYHAGICCQAVSTHTAANFKKFFNGVGHALDEVSMSISQDKANVDRYIIAKQGDIVYMAFQSEPTLSKWIDGPYGSFDNGLQNQMERIPIRYLIELIGNQNRIVFTGFSFGGMLACCNAARLWKESVIPVDILEDRVICITFGQPLVAISYVQETINAITKFENTIQAIFDQEDIFPRLLRNKYPTEQSRLKALDISHSGNTFEGSFPRNFLRDLSIYQEFDHSYAGTVSLQPTTTALERIKTLFDNVTSTEPDVCAVYGECYILSTEEGKGVTWSNLPKTIVQQLLHKIPEEKLTLKSPRKHIMEEYQQKIFRSHLEKLPEKYIPPSISSKELNEVAELKPQVESFNIHTYPSEHTLVLEGSNLWFCHEVHLGEKENVIHIKNSAETITGRSIQFNYKPTKKTDLLINHDMVKVTLHSHFANPIRKRVEVQQEPCSFSLRQIQLAKHTPSEVIKLAFSCAMLEQYPDNSVPSERLNAITAFLEDAVKVVPIESIFYAIGYCEDETAVECAEALLNANPKIPSSAEAIIGTQRAAVRMRTGLHGSFFDRILYDCLKSVSVPFGEVKAYSLVATSRDELVFSGSFPVYPIRVPLYANVVTGSVMESQSRDQPFALRLALPPPDREDILLYPEIANKLAKYSLLNFTNPKHDAVCNLSIEHIYPINSFRRHSVHCSTLKSPLEVLLNSRDELASLMGAADDLDSSNQETPPNNDQMLSLVKEVIGHNLKMCASLIGGFMEQTIRIPLLKSKEDTAFLLSKTSSPVAMGVWALFSLHFTDLHNMLSRMQGNPLLVEIADYISVIVSDDKQLTNRSSSKLQSKYAGKLQFLLQGMRGKTISCSSEYISYSLEHQLCNNLKFDKKISVKELIKDWDKIFKGDALSLVAKSHRSLVARWLKWAILVHDLRESLAKYTCVGVTGVVNSGKSLLVSTLFGLNIKVGTTNRKRTTVPILYNLDGKVNGLDVIDFPGVDDNDHSIPELAKLLVSLAQIVIFVVDYRRISTDPAKQWLEHLKNANVPVIVCLTYADRLYAEYIQEDKDPLPTDEKKRKIGADLDSKKDDIGCPHPSLSTNFYCLKLPADTTIRQEHLAKVGIGSTWDVGRQLVKIFDKIKQPTLASELKEFLLARSQLEH